jgi:hypothetical protein
MRPACTKFSGFAAGQSRLCPCGADAYGIWQAVVALSPSALIAAKEFCILRDCISAFCSAASSHSIGLKTSDRSLARKFALAAALVGDCVTTTELPWPPDDAASCVMRADDSCHSWATVFFANLTFRANAHRGGVAKHVAM